MKNSSTCWGERSTQILFSDSTACKDGACQPTRAGLPSILRFPRAYLVPHHGLLDGCEVLQRGEQDVTPLGTADIVDKAPELLAQGDEDLVFILDGLCSRGMLAMNGVRDIGPEAGQAGRLTIKEGDQLIAGALST